jgi:hypothetical protein
MLPGRISVLVYAETIQVRIDKLGFSPEEIRCTKSAH